MAGEVSITQGKIDVSLSNFARKYTNNRYVGELLFPRVPVLKQSDKFWQFGREAQRLAENDLRAAGAAAERIVQTVATSNYLADDHALERLIADEERANFEAGDVEQWATQTLSDKLLLALEDRIAVLATTQANYPAANRTQLAGAGTAKTNQWGITAAGSGQPIQNLMDGHAAIAKAGGFSGGGRKLLLLGADAFFVLKSNPIMQDVIKYTQLGVPSLQAMAAAFEVDEVIVAAAYKLDSAGAASFVWGKHAILAWVLPAAGMMDPSFGKNFVWVAAPGSTGGFIVETGRATPVSRKADELAVHFYYDPQITSNISAYFIQDAVA